MTGLNDLPFHHGIFVIVSFWPTVWDLAVYVTSEVTDVILPVLPESSGVVPVFSGICPAVYIRISHMSYLEAISRAKNGTDVLLVGSRRKIFAA